jgi:hypothetical protein
MTLSPAVAAQDGRFSPNAKTFAPLLFDFNDPANWLQGMVPTGIATIDLMGTSLQGTVVFRAPSTTLGGIVMRNATARVDAGRTVTLIGSTGVAASISGISWGTQFTVDGVLNSNVFIQATQGKQGMELTGTGTINGDVSMQGNDVSPQSGGSSSVQYGTLQINGDYVQGAPGADRTVGFDFMSDGIGTTSSKISVRGKATLGGNTVLSIDFNPFDTIRFPQTKTFTVLTATGGRTGTFARATIYPPITDYLLPPVMDYTDNEVLLTLTRKPPP